MPNLNPRPFFPLAFAVAILLSPSAFAQLWVGGDGAWELGVNWSTEQVPSLVTDATIDSGTAEASFGTNYFQNLDLGNIIGQSGALTVSGGVLYGQSMTLGVNTAATATVSGGTLEITGFLNVGSMGTGTLNVNGGTLKTTESRIAASQYNLAAIDGVVNVNTGGTWNNSGTLSVGEVGRGDLNIDGGTVTSTSLRVGYGVPGDGRITVSNNGTLKIGENAQNPSYTPGILEIGLAGKGSLTINGGTVTSGHTYLGGTPFGGPGEGSATVHGGTWSTAILHIGTSSKGTLVADGGTINSQAAIIGFASTGDGEVTIGENATWTIGGSPSFYGLAVGQTGKGALTIDGGTVNNFSSVIGLASGATGSVTVSDGKWVNGGTITIGSSGTGSVTISGVSIPIQAPGQPVPAALEYGEVEAMNVVLGESAGGSGTLTLTGGKIGALSANPSYLPAFTVGLSGTGKLVMSGGIVDAGAIVAGYSAGSTGTVEVSGGLLKYGTSGFIIGNSGTGTLTVEGGVVTALANPVLDTDPTPPDRSGYNYSGSSVTLGAEMSGSGTINLEGGTLIVGVLTVGKVGDGILNVSGGVLTGGGSYSMATQTNDNFPATIVLGDASIGEGTMNVTGGTVYTNGMTIGDEGTGTVNMDGGQILLSPLYTAGTTTLAAENGSHGTATMTAGVWNTGNLTIGAQGAGLFDLEGGTLTATQVVIGSGSNGSGTLNVTNATLNNTGSFVVGDMGDATATITNSTVTAGSVVVGYTPFSDSTLTLNSGTLDITNSVNIGSAGKGTFQINGGDVTSSIIAIGQNTGGDGTINLASGTLTNSGNIQVGGSGNATLNVSGGTLETDTATIGSSGSAVANLSAGNWTSTRTDVGTNQAGTMNVTGGTLSTDYLIVGRASTGTLNLDGGTISVDGGAGKVELGTESGGVGILNLGNGSTVGTLDAAEINGGSAGTSYVNFNHTGTVTFDQLLTGKLSIYKRGTGTSVLTGQSSYSGGTGIVGGTLEVATGGAINHGSSDIYLGEDPGSNGTLHVSGGDVTNLNTRIGAHANGIGTGRITAGNWATDNDLFVGYSGTGYLSVEGGNIISFNSYIGHNSGSQGTATTTGGEWNTALDLIVGSNGTGSLNVNGGVVTATDIYVGKNSGVTGSATVSSGTLTAYEDLTVGDQGTGTFTVNGGTVNVGGNTSPQGGDVYVGRASGGVGTINVSGGTLNNDRTFYIGHTGTGTANISGTGTALNKDAYLGYSTASSGTANVTGGTWTTDGELMVGRYGQGTLNISGGVVNSDTAQIGYFRGDPPVAPVTSTATVSGGTWNSESLTVGYYGFGVLNVTGTGVVSVDGGEGTLMLGREVSSSGTLNIGTGGAAGTIDAAIIQGGRDAFNYGTSVVNLNHTGTTTVNAAILGRITLNKLGSGLSILAGQNAYVSGTNIRNGTLQVASTGAINHTGASINIGTQSGDNGALVLDGGTIDVDSTFLGSVAGSTGSATVNSGTWTNTSYLYIGSSGTGSLSVKGGLVNSLVSQVGSLGTGTATVTGGEWRNRDLNVGMGSTGTVTIDGGLVKTTQDTNIAGTNNTGTIEVRSGTLETTGLTIGSNGTGNFNVNGGTVTTSVTRFGFNGAGNGVANVTAGNWTNSSDMYIGVGGTGTLNITGGIVTVNGTTTLALSPSSDGYIILGGVEGNRGVLATTQITKGSPGFGLVVFEGGVLRAISNQASLIDSSVGSVELTAAGGYFDSNGYSAGLTNIFYGEGSFNKIGAGTMTVSGNNTYSGGTVVEQGTLRVANSNSLGVGTVTVQTGGTLAINAQVDPLNEVKLAGGTYSRSFNLGADLTNSMRSTSDLENGRADTTVNILSGYNSQNGATISVSFSDTPHGASDSRRVSDILSLEGVSIVFGQRTDLFALELTIAGIEDGTYMGWYNGLKWINAVDGNFGNNATLAQQGFDGDFDAFRTLYGGDLASYIGAWGYTANGVWAVLNHNSEFALVNDAVPEPSSATLLLVAGAALAVLRRRRA